MYNYAGHSFSQQHESRHANKEFYLLFLTILRITACRKFPDRLVEPLFNKSSNFYATTNTVRRGGLRYEEQLRRQWISCVQPTRGVSSKLWFYCWANNSSGEKKDILWDVTHNIGIGQALWKDLGKVNWTRDLEIRILGDSEISCNKTSSYKIDLIGPQEVRGGKSGIAPDNSYVLLLWDMCMRFLYK